MGDAISFKYRAFLSYSHKDTNWAKWLHNRLEGFGIDKDLVGRDTVMGSVPKRLRPIFRDRDDFSGGHTLTDATIAALDQSAALLVLCSPVSGKSRYVNEEVRLFKSRHPNRPVIPVIIDGTYPDNFPNALRVEIAPNGTLTDLPLDILGPDLRETGDGKSLGLCKVVAGLIGAATDEIVRRAERAKRRRLLSWIAGLSCIAVALASLAMWAEVNRRDAVNTRNVALMNQSQLISGLSDGQNEGTAAALLLEVLPDATGDDEIRRLRPLWSFGETGLNRVLETIRERRIFGFPLCPIGLYCSNSVAFSRLGLIVTAGDDGAKARLWSATSGAQVGELEGHTERVTSVAFSPDGTRILTGSWDLTARLWNTKKGAEILQLNGHTQGINSVAFSPDGTRLLTGSYDSSARLWDANSGSELAQFKGYGMSAVWSVAFSPDGTRILTGSADGNTRLWDAKTGVEIAQLEGHTGLISSVAFSPDGVRIVTGSKDNSARLWDTKSGAELAQLKGHTDSVTSVAFSPDGTRILTGSWDHTAHLWDANTGADIGQLKGHTNGIQSVAFIPNGMMLTGSSDGTVRLWDAKARAESARVNPEDYLESVAFSPDGSRILTECRLGCEHGGEAHRYPYRSCRKRHLQPRWHAPLNRWNIRRRPLEREDGSKTLHSWGLMGQ
jgi:WD40 repeat protein